LDAASVKRRLPRFVAAGGGRRPVGVRARAVVVRARVEDARTRLRLHQAVLNPQDGVGFLSTAEEAALRGLGYGVATGSGGLGHDGEPEPDRVFVTCPLPEPAPAR
jgi:hypothetical protein